MKRSTYSHFNNMKSKLIGRIIVITIFLIIAILLLSPYYFQSKSEDTFPLLIGFIFGIIGSFFASYLYSKYSSTRQIEEAEDFLNIIANLGDYRHFELNDKNAESKSTITFSKPNILSIKTTGIKPDPEKAWSGKVFMNIVEKNIGEGYYCYEFKEDNGSLKLFILNPNTIIISTMPNYAKERGFELQKVYKLINQDGLNFITTEEYSIT